MNTTTRPIFSHKRIALVAHDSCKQNLLNWVKKHKDALAPHQLYATGTTGHLLERETGLKIASLLRIQRPFPGPDSLNCSFLLEVRI